MRAIIERGWWVLLLVGGITVVIWYAFYQQIIMGEPFGQHPASNFWLLIFTGLFGLGLPLLIYLIHLKVVVTSDKLSIRFFPLFSAILTTSGLNAKYPGDGFVRSLTAATSRKPLGGEIRIITLNCYCRNRVFHSVIDLMDHGGRTNGSHSTEAA